MELLQLCQELGIEKGRGLQRRFIRFRAAAGLILCESQPVTALCPAADFKENVIFRHRDRGNEFCAEAITGFAGGNIVRVASDPDLSHAVMPGEIEEKSAGAGGEVISPETFFYMITDVACVLEDIERISHAQFDAP